MSEQDGDQSQLWLVVRTAPKFVGIIQSMAEQAGAYTWKPVYAKRVRVGKSRKPAVKLFPIFPGYFFLPLDQIERLGRMPTRRYQVLRSEQERFLKVEQATIDQIAEQERELCKLEPDPKPVTQFSVGDLVQPLVNLFGEPMRIVAIHGNHLDLDFNGKRMRVDAAAAKKVA